MRFISHHEVEQGLICNRVEVVIISKLSMGDLISPGTQIASTEDLKVGFNLLANVFCFTI